ncbi:hypothetical protein E8E12_003177 [Didymella heteroderae]|uniref:Uncharacterized protein n=1 Tax=Didymella heteroderae TaxID=1769908 RepID=A0A9P4WMX2_9PLEO|nr:hypothetical protein E8E12_003177 [Didymella heteroderae]
MPKPGQAQPATVVVTVTPTPSASVGATRQFGLPTEYLGQVPRGWPYTESGAGRRNETSFAVVAETALDSRECHGIACELETHIRDAGGVHYPFVGLFVFDFAFGCNYDCILDCIVDSVIDSALEYILGCILDLDIAFAS